MIEIRQSKVFRGPNIWARVPAIHLVVDIGELEERPSSVIPGFVDRLIGLVPSLSEQECSRGHPGGFVERLHEGTWLSHVLEHVAIELQRLTGADISHGKTRETTERRLGIAITCDDGSPRGLGPAAIQVLEELGLAPPAMLDKLRERHAGSVASFAGEPVSEVRPRFRLLHEPVTAG
jgi:hypothetical protein